MISLESTTYPGTTEEQLKPRIEAAGFSVGADIFLVFSPEREDPANPHYTTKNTPKVCGADTPNCLRAGLERRPPAGVADPAFAADENVGVLETPVGVVLKIVNEQGEELLGTAVDNQ